MALVEVQNLRKSFRTFKRSEGILGSFKDLFSRQYSTLNAVDGISFKVEEGELLGYLGPNGAGKSTSIKMLTGILKPTDGEITVMGYHPFRDRRAYTAHIGVVFGQRTQLWWDIAVLESLKLLAKIYRVSDSEFKSRLELLTETLGLKDLLHTPVRKLSLGQRIRCDLAGSLIYGPKILFLDEPTIGLDAVGKDAVRAFLRKINRDLKATIIMTTHDLKEIEELCQRILIIDKGRIIYDGSLERVRTLPGLKRRIYLDFAGSAPESKLNEIFGTRVAFERESERRLAGSYDPRELSTPELVKEVFANFDVADFTVSEPELEEVIMKIYREGAGAL
ncbi:MAG: ATP-binding cassette domain-containing protein [Oligoflexia bacterium]|nr:ATP-binding cassette domain-containing protein [Oligoflexia bacterium]